MVRDGALQTRELYGSANGDRWLLARDNRSGRIFVRHEANLASGGRISDVEIARFLTVGLGPEQQSLLALIGSLVEDRPPNVGPPDEAARLPSDRPSEPRGRE